ncbi:MAG: DNA primase [Gomphosphaeria aponina SAG 52.96 = DSM 107014]|uniref:DNA primase n=1 Tax=Gomphosphaeria aponina SAG 52.96 = DSM 107014 TaxID=1521640 RepID=A0A941GR71_9CHRO|nr:DNA primase [Gomphosphaeria aponina SAG 52.96 = DSM 107014]
METAHLHPDTIEEVKEKVDIVDIISDNVVLRKRGKDYFGLCPFHKEKTPSFSVSPSKQLYYCFGCGTGGSAIKFLMELGKQSFQTVVLDLAQRYQIPLKTLEPKQRLELERQISLREQLYEILALTASFYQHALQQPQGEGALTYLQSERNLRSDTIQQFQLGYAPGGWETLYRYLVEEKRYSVELVAEAGLIKKRKSEDGYYDQFRDRLMIPICDHQGRIIAFGSRTLSEEQPKYLNSPETPLFNKSKTLFALNLARNQIIEQDLAVIVEGYFDAIALHARGISNVVACLGTALTSDQLKLLLRYTDSKQVVFNFDGDTAGINAAQRAIGEIESLILAGQVQLRVLNLPNSKDADEFMQAHPDAIAQYRTLLETAPLWLDWLIIQTLTGHNLKQADEFQHVAQKLVKLLTQIDHLDLRTHYLAKSAELLSRGDAQYFKKIQEDLHTQVNQRRKGGSKKNSSIFLLPEQTQLEQAEALLLRIYLHFPAQRNAIFNTLEEKDLLFSLSHHRYLWRQILKLEPLPPEKNSASDILTQLASQDFPEMAQVIHLFELDETTQGDIARLPLLMQAAIASLELVSCENHKRYCYEQWQKLDSHTNSDQWQYYYQEYFNFKQRMIALESQRHFTLLDLLNYH